MPAVDPPGHGKQAGPPVVFVDQSGQLGGAELFLADLARECGSLCRVVLLEEGPFGEHLKTRGVAAEAVSLPGKAKRLSKSAGVLAMLKAAPQIVAFFLAVQRRLSSAELIYCNTPKAIVMGGLAALLGRKKLVVHLHDLLTREHFSGLNLKLLHFFSQRAAFVIANSRATADTFVAAGGRASAVEVVYNGFDPAQFARPEGFSRAQTRAKLGLPDAPLLGIFGRLTRWKGQHVALEAMRSLPGAHLAVIGEALFTEDDRRYREELQQAAAEGGLNGRIHFLGFKAEVTPLLHAMDVVVHCSVAAEPFGRVIVEAMLAGTPVVATRGGGVNEIVTDGQNGLIVPPGDAAALATAVKSLLDDPQLAGRLSAAGLSHARATFSLEKTVGRIRQMLQDSVR